MARLIKHISMDKCNKATYMWLRRRYVEMVERFREMGFILCGVEGGARWWRD